MKTNIKAKVETEGAKAVVKVEGADFVYVHVGSLYIQITNLENYKTATVYKANDTEMVRVLTGTGQRNVDVMDKHVELWGGKDEGLDGFKVANLESPIADNETRVY
jgi:hypothetical protein